MPHLYCGAILSGNGFPVWMGIFPVCVILLNLTTGGNIKIMMCTDVEGRRLRINHLKIGLQVQFGSLSTRSSVTTAILCTFSDGY